MIEHLHQQIIPPLEKDLGDMVIEYVDQNNKKLLGLKADIKQRFDTQIHILNHLTKMINLDQQNLKKLIKDRDVQQQIDIKVITTELKQTGTKMDILVNSSETLMNQITVQTTAQEEYYKKTGKW